jgi:ribonuclease VapC
VIFIDTSVFVAILAREPDGRLLARAISSADARMTSPIVRLEASIVLASRLDVSPSQAEELFDEFLQEASIREISLGPAEGAAAVACFETFGKGRHPARLNFADCLVYACAKGARAQLLYKGGDFAKSDANAWL